MKVNQQKLRKSSNFGRLFKRISSSMESGFALIATISVMVLLVMIALAMLTLSTVEMRSSNNSLAMLQAQQNARMALMLAIADLQKAAGPDQRVTATASILENDPSQSPASGHEHWVGVWDTSDYSPDDPNSRTFVKWLVSSEGDAVASDVSFAANVSATSTNGSAAYADTVTVPMVNIIDESGEITGKYSYWVEDEGVKASLGWHEGEGADAERSQAARLSATPGPDYAVFEGPFTSTVNHPIAKDTTGWLERMEKARNPSDMPLVVGSDSHFRDWLEENRHNISMGTRGLLTNTKLGGLRQDLSLAFEMDGEAEANDATKFNQQDGVFVGGADVLSSTTLFANQLVKARYIHRDTPTSSGLFSTDVPEQGAAAPTEMKGANWWALRDYANLYKRITGTAGDYTLASRVPFPNNEKEGGGVTPMSHYEGNPILDTNYVTLRDGSRPYMFRHSQPAYSPALIGMGGLLSLGSESNNLALYLDSYFIVWNPYNFKITCPRYGIALKEGFPVNLKLTAAGSGLTAVKNTKLYDYLNDGRSVVSATRVSYVVDNLELEPGEVAFLTRPPDAEAGISVLNGRMVKGFNIDLGTGHPVTTFGTAKSIVQLSSITSAAITCELNISTGNKALMNLKAFYDDDFAADYDSYDGNADQGVSLQGRYIKFNGRDTTDTSPEIFNINDPIDIPVSDISGSSRVFFASFSLLTKAATRKDKTGMNTNIQPFAQFNPIAHTATSEAEYLCSLNQALTVDIDEYNGIEGLIEASGIELHESDTAAFWGPSFASVGGAGNIGGTTSVPLLDLPAAPIHSLVSFTHANLGIRAHEPINAIGNSLATPFVDPASPYGTNPNGAGGSPSIAYDSSWLYNEALFDDYYLSGFAPDFTIDAAGYSENSTLNETIEAFFQVSGTDYLEAKANPVLVPHIPDGVTADDIVDELDSDVNTDGYQKLGAYSMIKGAFNINSTSIRAWEAMLRGNRGLDVLYANGGSDAGGEDTTPFPSGGLPSQTTLSEEHWAGLSRLSDSQITSLATEIVEQVKLRGPFMSLSDFVNHRVGTPKVDETHYKGALQAAIDDSGINSLVDSAAAGTAVDYGVSSLSENFVNPISGAQSTTANIPGDITQAKVLLPLAPRITARSDTFRVRAFGETWSDDGTKLLARAACEAVIQRLPEYVDPVTDESNNEPWDDAGNVSLVVDASVNTVSTLNTENQTFGRRFKVVNFRWLSQGEL